MNLAFPIFNFKNRNAIIYNYISPDIVLEYLGVVYAKLVKFLVLKYFLQEGFATF